MKRGRAYRRFQNKRVIKKRLNILKKCWGYGTKEYGTLREQDTPGYLKKWNFTCDCRSCRISKQEGRKEKYERQYVKGCIETDYDDYHLEAWDNFHGDSVFD